LNNKFVLFFIINFTFSLIFISCSEVPVATSTPVKFDPTPAVKGSRTSDSSGNTQNLVILGDSITGESLFVSQGCNACHSLGSDKLVGPGMLGVYARSAERTTLSADEYLTESIRYPGEFLVEGFENLMPTTFEGLSDTDIKDLIAYLKTLE
tara:strand:- start:24168 stop:24623 length:456 start_codon:yes stop_codon:yes gene_type:complete